MDDLSLTDKIFLGAFLREGISEDYSYIKPIVSFVNPLTPTYEFCAEIINRLKSIKALVIHPDTFFEYIEITDYDNGKYKYYPYHVRWSINVKSNEFNHSQLIESLVNPKDFDNSQNDEILQLWKKIALYESVEYFK
jgi:hypothetical protein